MCGAGNGGGRSVGAATHEEKEAQLQGAHLRIHLALGQPHISRYSVTTQTNIVLVKFSCGVASLG